MGTFKKLTLVSMSLLSLVITGCQKTENTQTQTEKKATKEPNTAVKTLNMGFQKSALNLLVARDQNFLQQQFPNTKIEWKEFPAGPQMLEALAIGAVDFGYVGNMPPIFAQAANKDLNYIAYENYPQNSLALVIKDNSSIQNIESLKGKRIAVQKGSSAHELLAKILQKANLTWNDIEPIWLPPADARAAFDKGSVDAWVIWDPYLAAVEFEGHAKPLIDGQAFSPTYSYYIANPKFVQAHPDAPEKVIKSVNEADQWIVNNLDVAIEIYSKNTGLKPIIAQKSIDRRLKPSPVKTLTPEVIESQQKIADLFHELKLIPTHIDIKKAVWLPNSAQ